MTSKHYGWQKRWTVNHAAGSARHEHGLVVLQDMAGRRQVIGAETVAESLRPKHGHNADAMVQRLIKEAGILLGGGHPAGGRAMNAADPGGWVSFSHPPTEPGWYQVRMGSWAVPRLYWSGAGWFKSARRTGQVLPDDGGAWLLPPVATSVDPAVPCGDIGEAKRPTRADTIGSLPVATPQTVRAARLAAGQSQAQAAALIGLADRSNWAAYERDPAMPTARQIDAAKWSLYLLATDQHPSYRLAARRARRSGHG